nr:MAG: capsid protein [Chemarfal virus 88]
MIKRANNKMRKTTQRRRKAVTRPQVSKAVKVYLKKALKKSAELKTATPYVVNNSAIRAYGISPNGPSQLTTFALSDVLTIPQGTGDGQRIGDRIRVKSMNVKGYINLDSQYAGDAAYLKNPMYVKLFVGRRLDTLANPNTISGGFSKLLAAGPTSQSPTNLPADMYRYINKELYQILHTRKFKIGTSAPSNNPSDSAQYNNDFSWARNFSINLSKNIETVKFSDGGSSPSNVGLYMWFMVVFANGAAITTLTNTPLECHFDVNCTYYDS